MDMSEFYQTFFSEAEELLADMEHNLLALDVGAPDHERLNAIFRSAHSIKGGAGTFGFIALQETTHLLENLLDEARSGQLQLTGEIVNVFLEGKDVMQEQLEAYKASEEPDAESYHAICEALRRIALDEKQNAASVALPPPAAAEPDDIEQLFNVVLKDVSPAERTALLAELAHFGELRNPQERADSVSLQLRTTTGAEDIRAVLCFLLEPEQIAITPETAAETPAPVPAAVINTAPRARPATAPQGAESSSIRVAVEKVDQVINQVGELIITQAMLSQLSTVLDPGRYDALISSIAQLERNARDLQESVMSIRMMPMEYVFSRFPRLVHDLGAKLDKKVNLTLKGGSAELDKSLIERIIDPLTHLVRNSLDHGIEPMECRQQKGKPEVGNLTLSAEHHGGNVVIEVTDDGAGLNREKILARAQAQGLTLADNLSDEEVWMLIFAAGFSTAEKVTDVSGRGVGMDVVRRNIQEMGGHVEIHSIQDVGSTIRIILPLTLAILDGMSVRVGDEIYVLPLNAVMESLKPAETALHRMTGNELMLKIRGEYMPLIELSQLFHIPCDSRCPTDGVAVVLQGAGGRYALLVDQLIGQHQVVVKNLECNYRKVPGVSAATILGGGSVALILDVAALVGLAKRKLQVPRSVMTDVQRG